MSNFVKKILKLEGLAENISSFEQLQTTNPKLQTEEMEVHHHGHIHEKKKWKEYVFQFFMLFLAVFSEFLQRIN